MTSSCWSRIFHAGGFYSACFVVSRIEGDSWRRFVSSFGGDQFALPEVLDSLRAVRHQELKGDITIAGADPMNLTESLLLGERLPAVPGRSPRPYRGITWGFQTPCCQTQTI